MAQSSRKQVLGYGTLFVSLLAFGAAYGAYAAAHGRYWMTRANGSFTLFHWGWAAAAGSAFLGLYACVTSAQFDSMHWLLPVHGRWARYLANGVLVLLALLAAFLLISQPIA